MKTSASDFFLPSNAIKTSEIDNIDVSLLVKAAEAFARSTSQCVYIIDYYKQNFLYISDKIEDFCGINSSEAMELGYELYINHVPHNELEILREINKKGFTFFHNIPLSERCNYSITYDFHLINGKKSRMVCHKLTPMLLSKDGNLWLALCTITISPKNMPGNIIVKKENSSEYYYYNLNIHSWVKGRNISLRDTEREILTLSAQGYTMTQIAEFMCKSVDTIKACKKQMFSKMKVRSISEAISYANNYRLI